MQDMRSDIRVAFEREQARNPVPSNLPDRIELAVASQPRRRAGLQWIAAAAAILIAALVVAGLSWSRLAHNVGQARPKASPIASPTATPFVEDYGTPPAGVPLIYLQDPKNPAWYIGFDWSGIPRGTVKLAQAIDAQGSVTQAPDGSGFAVAPAAKGGFQVFLDRLGQQTGTQDSTTRFQDQMWADDSSRLCTLDYDSHGWHIGVRSPGDAPVVHAVALDPSIVQSGNIAISFRSCSLVRDRAVLVYNAYGHPTDVYVVRLSDGGVLLHQSHPANSLADITASPDGSLIAESSNRSTGYLMDGPASNTVVRRVTDNAVVATLDPGYGVLAFSHDNTLALVNTSPWASGVATHLAVVRLSDRAILWKYDGSEEFAGSLSRPDAPGIAVLLEQPTAQISHTSVDVVIIAADGTATTPPDRYIRP